MLDLIHNGAYLSISDFLREAIREQLKTYKVANLREISYLDAKREVISYFIKYNDCYLDEIAIDLELDFELVFNIVNELILEGRVAEISGDETLKGQKENNGETNNSQNKDNLLKIDGKRLIIESRSKNYEFISIRNNMDYNAIFKNNGIVVDNGTVILSKRYSFIK